MKTRLDAVLSGTVTVGNVQEQMEDEPVSAPVIDTKPTELSKDQTIVNDEEEDTMDYFQKLANG